MKRLVPAMAVAIALLCVPASSIASPSAAASSTPASQLRPYDKTFLKYLNQARVSAGLKPYKQSARLYRMAHRWAEHLVASRNPGINLVHNPQTFSIKTFRKASGCPKARTDGENVGGQTSTDPKQLFDLYMSDPAHRDNNMSPKYNAPRVPGFTDVGIATVAVPDGVGSPSEVNVMDFANNCD